MDFTAPAQSRDCGDGKIGSIADLRRAMTGLNPQGDRFLDYLLEGELFDGKGVWINDDAAVAAAYGSLLAHNPQLVSESPYGSRFARERVRTAGENEVLVSALADAPRDFQQAYADFRVAVAAGRRRPRALCIGGPAAKIAALLLRMRPAAHPDLEVVFAYDGGEQSNESASAHYEHTNHANALNAEHNNSGLAILALALRRALVGEPDPEVALDPDYHKVDLWPHGLHLRDLPVFAYNELHGRLQRLKTALNRLNDHDRSRLASRVSTRILSHIEQSLGVSLRLPDDGARSFFLYLSRIEHDQSFRENADLARFAGIRSIKVGSDVLRAIYGDGAVRNVLSGDIFPDNHCIRHGFDRICLEALAAAGGEAWPRTAVREIYVTGVDGGAGTLCAGVRLADVTTGRERFVPLNHLLLSLGPTATYRFARSRGLQRLADRIGILQPVPHQTIATGFTSQLLFRISDHDRFRLMPHTGLKQTHFVEVGRWDDQMVIKLTSGGNIGLPVYSRSYALGALANLFRILAPGCGLDFVDVVCAWPGSRGINGPNNGQVVRLADNAALRFGEGGTGMSKMGTNAQTLLDMVGLASGLPGDLTLDRTLYAHTVIDRRGRVRRRLLA